LTPCADAGAANARPQATMATDNIPDFIMLSPSRFCSGKRAKTHVIE
jgi:hypothetical protein